MNTAAKAIADSHGLQGRFFQLFWDRRQHSLGLIMAVVMVLGSAFAVVYERNIYRSTLSAFQSAEQIGNELSVSAKQLALEQSAWSTQSRVQRLAEDKLQMHAPDYRHLAMVKL